MSQAQALISRALGIKVDKASLTDLSTNESKPFLFNPADLSITFGAKWNMFESPGLSHSRPQFVVGKNVSTKFTAFFDQLFFDIGKPAVRKTSGPETSTINTLDGAGQGKDSEVEDWLKFLESLVTRRRVTGGLNSISAASPPPVLLDWPGIMSLAVRIETATVKHSLFRAGNPRPRVYSIDFDIFEDPERGYYSDEVRKTGLFRPWAASSRRGR